MHTVRVIFVHGGFHKVVSWNYSEVLSEMLVRELVKLGLIPRRASQDQIDSVITFEHINYSDVGFDAQTRVLNAVSQQREQLYTFVKRLSRALWLDDVRQQIVGGYGDVFLYRTDYWGEQIRKILLDTIEPHVGRGDPVTIIGHSLGTLVAFDTLFENARNNPTWRAEKFRPTNLFTMGSPIALFSYDIERQVTELKEIHGEDIVNDLQLVENDGVWYNFLDAQDLVAYPLEALFQDTFRVNDVMVQTGNTPMKAHGGYWNNDELARIVAARLHRDYERVNNLVPA